MEERLILQVKRIYHETKQAINECTFLTKRELDQILLLPSEEKLIINVDANHVSLIKAASLLRELHARFLRTFVLSAFDLTWDMITTPKRFEYAKQKELELYNSLMNIANLKQDEIKLMIRETINFIKQDLIDSIASSTFSIDHTTHSNIHHFIYNPPSRVATCNSLTNTATTLTTNSTSSSVAAITTSSSVQDVEDDDSEDEIENDDDDDSVLRVVGDRKKTSSSKCHNHIMMHDDNCISRHDVYNNHPNHLTNLTQSHHQQHNITTNQRNSNIMLNPRKATTNCNITNSSVNHNQTSHSGNILNYNINSKIGEDLEDRSSSSVSLCRNNHYKSVESDSSQLTSISVNSLENISSKSELQLYRQEIQEFVLQQLNASIASKLVGSVESLRNSYVGTLERCLTSLEQNFIDNNETPNALMALRQILNAAYRVEVSVQSSTSALRTFWEKMKQLVGANFPLRIFYGWNNYACIIDEQWRRQQALDIVDNLSETRLAKSICSQFRARLKSSHEQFLTSIRELELHHADRLQHTEDLRLRVRKMHAPRMAKFALESTSLIDLILYGMPCLEKEIGRGQYGVVYACESWAGHSSCAVKSMVPPDDRHWYDLAMEFYYTRCIPEHERIVRIYGSVIDHSYGSGSTPAVLLVMERLNRDLYSAILFGLDWLSRLQVAIDVVEGIRFLHNQGLVHRDIKLKNILLDSNNRAKITDLGFCKPEAMMSGSVVGTPIHMSPELFSGKYDNSVDVYAFGILFWYICAGHVRLPHIFDHCLTRDQLWNGVRKGVRPERLPQFDNECWQLMVQCWDGDKTRRPHLGDVEITLRQIHARYT